MKTLVLILATLLLNLMSNAQTNDISINGVQQNCHLSVTMLNMVTVFISSLGSNSEAHATLNFDRTKSINADMDLLKSQLPYCVKTYSEDEDQTFGSETIELLTNEEENWIPIDANIESLKFDYYLDGNIKAIVKLNVYDEYRNTIGTSEAEISNPSVEISKSELKVDYLMDGKAAYFTLEMRAVSNNDSIYGIGNFLFGGIQLSYQTSMDMAHGEDLIEIFPNPANSYFQVKSKKYDFLDVEVIDYTGKVNVLDVDVNGIVNISNFTEGVYTVVIKDNGLVYTRKLVVRH